MVSSLDGILSKLDSPTLGMAFGFLATELNNDQRSGRPMFANLQGDIEWLMRTPHFPNIQHVIEGLTSGPYGEVFKPAIMVGIGGWLLDQIDMNPTISRLGKTMQTLGFNGALGSVALCLLDHSTQMHSDGNPPGQPYGGHNGYPRGAGYSPLERRNGGYFTMPNVPPQTPTLPTILPASPRP